jgi:UDP-N-acetylglucosamine acyltransferase
MGLEPIVKGKIGKGCKIGPGAIIDENVELGENVVVEPFAVVTGFTKVGDGTHIYSHAVVGSPPQDLKYRGEESWLIIGRNNKIREFTLLNPGTAHGGGVTKIGDNNLLMGYVHVAHDVKIGNNCILANGVTLAGHVELGDFVVIGGLTPVHQFVRIGSYAMVGGASAVSQDIPPYMLAEGNRAKVRGLNLVGLRRNLGDRQVIDLLKRAYRELFLSGRPIREVAEELVQSENPHLRNLGEFILNSKRGIPFHRPEE